MYPAGCRLVDKLIRTGHPDNFCIYIRLHVIPSRDALFTSLCPPGVHPMYPSGCLNVKKIGSEPHIRPLPTQDAVLTSLCLRGVHPIYPADASFIMISEYPQQSIYIRWYLRTRCASVKEDISLNFKFDDCVDVNI